LNRGTFHEEILKLAAEGALVLTATRRLARQLLDRDRQDRAGAGQVAWIKPGIFSGQDWLMVQLLRLGSDWKMLSPVAARHIWEEVIEDDAQASGLDLLQVGASAIRAQEAHQLLAEYDTEVSNYLLSDDHEAFLRWRRAYRLRLQADGWDDPAELAGTIAAALAANRLEAPPCLVLAGFDQVPPALQRIADVVGRDRTRILSPASHGEPQALVAAFPDARAEVQGAARWSRRLLENGATRIGVVVPDLAAYRDAIDQVFREELDPRALLGLSDEESRFGLSLGAPLGQLGPVAAALSLLGCTRELECEELSSLLRSPYLGGGETEGTRRERYDAALRRLRRQRISLLQLDALHHSGRLPAPPRLLQIVGTLEKALESGRKATPGAWCARFRQLLADLGWPGERPLDSRDFQIVRHWEEKLLPRFAALDEVSRSLAREEAVSCLRRLAQEEVFQQEMPDPGIQVCGVLEAGGLEFDHLWILGLHENAWPLPPRPNPFIPVRLQVENRMPRADAAGEEAYARQALQRLLAAAPEVICSFPQQEGSCPLRPSLLLQDLPAGAPLLAGAIAPARQLNRLAPALESQDDQVAKPLAVGAELKGGTGLLRDQARCPFRAFARHRLGTRALETPAAGLDPATRGTLVHKCLEIFWQRAGNHASLQAWDATRRQAEIAASVEAALAADAATLALLPPPLLAVERERLGGLLEEWLVRVELERPAAAVAVVTEEAWSANCGGVTIATKVDRCDRLGDGRLLILDYKTGQIEIDDLLGARLLEPQLPIYAVNAGGEELAGVAVGILKRGGCKLLGLARDGDLFERVPSFGESRAAGKHQLADWTALLRHWKEGLETLGEEIRSGQAAVAPVSVQKACRTCDLAWLCRVGDSPVAGANAGEES
jgi:ATP-dependent helicase/nuclease subunit B